MVIVMLLRVKAVFFALDFIFKNFTNILPRAGQFTPFYINISVPSYGEETQIRTPST